MSTPRKQQGFTLIELVVVIVILGILAATALPRFINLSADAGDAAAAGVAGAISSGAAMNYSQSLLGTTGTAIVSGTATCATLDGLLVGGARPTDVEWVSSTALITCTSPAGAGGTSTGCQLEHTQGTTGGTPATVVTAICTG